MTLKSSAEPSYDVLIRNNCQVYLGVDEDAIKIVSRLDEDNFWTANVLKTSEDRRARHVSVLSEKGKSLQDVLCKLHRQSAKELHTYVSEFGFSSPQDSTSEFCVSDFEDDDDDDESRQSEASDTEDERDETKANRGRRRHVPPLSSPVQEPLRMERVSQPPVTGLPQRFERLVEELPFKPATSHVHHTVSSQAATYRHVQPAPAAASSNTCTPSQRAFVQPSRDFVTGAYRPSSGGSAAPPLPPPPPPPGAAGHHAGHVRFDARRAPQNAAVPVDARRAIINVNWSGQCQFSLVDWVPFWRMSVISKALQEVQNRSGGALGTRVIGTLKRVRSGPVEFDVKCLIDDLSVLLKSTGSSPPPDVLPEFDVEISSGPSQ